MLIFSRFFWSETFMLYVYTKKDIKTFVYLCSIAKMRKKYTNVGIPEELAKEIDSLIKKLKMGFRSRAEFVTEAIRQKIENQKPASRK